MSLPLITTTFPIGARKTPSKLGLHIPGVLSNTITNSIDNSRNILAINILDSQGERISQLESLISTHQYLWMHSEHWIDGFNKQALISNLDILVNKWIIFSKNFEMWKCSDKCWKVNMDANTPLQKTGRVYFLDNDGIPVCSCCNHKTIKIKQTWLFFNADNNWTLEYPNILPLNIKKDVINLINDSSSKDILISRDRETGIKYLLNWIEYNIDVDFLWMTFLNCLPENNWIVFVGSARMRRYAAMIHVLYNCIMDNPSKMSLILPFYKHDTSWSESLVNGWYLEQDSITMRKFLESEVNLKKDTKWSQNKYNDLITSFNSANNSETIQQIISNIKEYFYGITEDIDNPWVVSETSVNIHALTFSDLPTKIKEACISNIVTGVIQFGSSTIKNDAKDIDLAIIIKKWEFDNFVKQYTSIDNKLYDISLIKEEEINQNFSFWNHWVHLIPAFKKWKVLFWENKFLNLNDPDRKELLISIKTRLADYLYQLRKQYFETNQKSLPSWRYSKFLRFSTLFFDDSIWYSDVLNMTNEDAEDILKNYWIILTNDLNSNIEILWEQISNLY